MKKLLLLIAPILALGTLGCDDSDDSDASIVDSIIVTKNEYYAVPFEVPQEIFIKVKMKKVNEISAEGYLVTEEEYQKWVDVTQTGDFQGATLDPIYYFYLDDSTNLDTGWLPLEEGNYRLLFENTDFGAISPPEHPVNRTGTTNIMCSIHIKGS